MTNTAMTIKIFIILMLFVISCNGYKGDTTKDKNMIFEKGDKASDEIFTDTVWVKMLHTDEEQIFDTQVYNVVFEPSARTYWHSHPGGQILLVTEGAGYYQEKGKSARKLKKGDVVAISPEVVHWHGAAPESEFIHLGMSTQVHMGPAKWFGPVTEQEYKEAVVE